MSELERRVERLEGRLRHWQRIAGGLMGAVALLGLVGATSGQQGAPPPEEIRTRRLVLSDENGRARAALAINDEGMAIIALMDGARHTRAALYVAEDGATGLSLADASQKPRVRLELNDASDRPTGLILQDAEEKARAELTVGANGAPRLKLTDPSGKVILNAPE